MDFAFTSSTQRALPCFRSSPTRRRAILPSDHSLPLLWGEGWGEGPWEHILDRGWLHYGADCRRQRSLSKTHQAVLQPHGYSGGDDRPGRTPGLARSTSWRKGRAIPYLRGSLWASTPAGSGETAL